MLVSEKTRFGSSGSGGRSRTKLGLVAALHVFTLVLLAFGNAVQARVHFIHSLNYLQSILPSTTQALVAPASPAYTVFGGPRSIDPRSRLPSKLSSVTRQLIHLHWLACNQQVHTNPVSTHIGNHTAMRFGSRIKARATDGFTRPRRCSNVFKAVTRLVTSTATTAAALALAVLLNCSAATAQTTEYSSGAFTPAGSGETVHVSRLDGFRLRYGDSEPMASVDYRTWTGLKQPANQGKVGELRRKSERKVGSMHAGASCA